MIQPNNFIYTMLLHFLYIHDENVQEKIGYFLPQIL